MLDRLVIIVALAALTCLGVIAVRAWTRRSGGRLMARPGGELLVALGTENDGRPTIVTFSTPSCGACRTAQAPAVEQVERALGAEKVRVLQIDASRQPHLARAFGVLTVPSSVVLDPSGRVSAINHGFAPSQQLLRQLEPA